MNKEDLLKIFKNKNNRLICLILIIGVVLMAVASVDKNKKADVQMQLRIKFQSSFDSGYYEIVNDKIM